MRAERKENVWYGKRTVFHRVIVILSTRVNVRFVEESREISLEGKCQDFSVNNLYNVYFVCVKCNKCHSGFIWQSNLLCLSWVEQGES